MIKISRATPFWNGKYRVTRSCTLFISFIFFAVTEEYNLRFFDSKVLWILLAKCEKGRRRIIKMNFTICDSHQLF
jgi:hypothetical protein